MLRKVAQHHLFVRNLAPAKTPKNQSLARWHEDCLVSRMSDLDVAASTRANASRAQAERVQSERVAAESASKTTTPSQRDQTVAGASAVNELRGQAAKGVIGETKAPPTAPAWPGSSSALIPATLPSGRSPTLPSGRAPTPWRNPLQIAEQGVRGAVAGVKDSVLGIVNTVKTVAKVATDPAFRAKIVANVVATREAIRTPEGRKAVGEGLRDAARSAVQEGWAAAKENPAKAIGYVAGAVLTGGALVKGAQAIGRAAQTIKPVAEAVKAAQPAIDVAKRAHAAYEGAKPVLKPVGISAGIAASVAALTDDKVRSAIADVARTVAHAPAATVAAAASLWNASTRALLRAGSQRTRDEAQRETGTAQ
jgi:hypothetical protein